MMQRSLLEYDPKCEKELERNRIKRFVCYIKERQGEYDNGCPLFIMYYFSSMENVKAGWVTRTLGWLLKKKIVQSTIKYHFFVTKY